MKKILAFSIFLFSAVLFSGCGQDINLTVYNDTGIVPGSETYCGARVEWNNGTEAHLFSGSGNSISDSNSFSVTVKEGYDVTVIGYGWYIVSDSSGNTSAASYEQSASANVYGSYLDSKKWYACLYMDKVLIYNK